MALVKALQTPATTPGPLTWHFVYEHSVECRLHRRGDVLVAEVEDDGTVLVTLNRNTLTLLVTT